jgi:hypothetical protein
MIVTWESNLTHQDNQYNEQNDYTLLKKIPQPSGNL